MSVLAAYLCKIALFKLFVIRCQSELLLVIGLHVSKGQRPNKF